MNTNGTDEIVEIPKPLFAIRHTPRLLIISTMQRASSPGRYFLFMIILFSFVVGIGFGEMIDVHDAWLALLPNTMTLNVLYFALGFLIIGFGIALANRCKLPIIPTDTFPRDMSEILNKPYKYVKTTFDLCCLTTTLVLSIGILHGFHGVGIGTVLCAFITGKTVSMFQKVLDDHVVFYRAVIRPTKPEIFGRTV